MHILLYFLLTLHVLVCLLMVLVVLMQRPRNEGLGAAFGSGMTDNIFGAQTTNVLAKFTTWLGGTFFVLTLALAMVYARLYSGNTSLEKQLMNLPQPAAAAAAPTPAPVAEPLPAQPSPTAAVETPAVSSTAASAPTPEASATPAPANAAPNVPVESPASSSAN
jgi:preprotein translocase subunit SecG